MILDISLHKVYTMLRKKSFLNFVMKILLEEVLPVDGFPRKSLMEVPVVSREHVDKFDVLKNKIERLSFRLQAS